MKTLIIVSLLVIVGQNQEAIEKVNLTAQKTQNRVRSFCQLEATRRHELRLASFYNTRFIILKSSGGDKV